MHREGIRAKPDLEWKVDLGALQASIEVESLHLRCQRHRSFSRVDRQAIRFEEGMALDP